MQTPWAEVSVAILAGGLGTRLRCVVGESQKVLAKVGGRPHICHLLDRLAEAEVQEVVLLAGYQAEHLRGCLGAKYQGIRLVYSTEQQPLGTAGAIRHGLARLSAANILVWNGDSFCEVDLSLFVEHHQDVEADVTLGLTQVDESSRFGKVELEEETSRITGFAEKQASGSGWINAGLYLFRREMVERIPTERFVSLEKELFPTWINKYRVLGYQIQGNFHDIGTPESYQEANRCLAKSTSH